MLVANYCRGLGRKFCLVLRTILLLETATSMRHLRVRADARNRQPLPAGFESPDVTVLLEGGLKRCDYR
jgi:uncharacterized SAM-binding protein YcdF (DUF218 family)